MKFSNNYKIFVFTLTTCFIFISCNAAKKKHNFSNNIITPGAVWRDNNGNQIQAHGGGVIKLEDTYYWFGEYRAKDDNPLYRYVGCYSSKDLIHWTFRKKIQFSAPDGFNPKTWVLERPKVFYNAKTRKYVMYFHLDDNHYRKAEVGVAVSDSVDGNYQFVRHFRPLGKESRDIGQFIDDDGSAYLIFESRPSGGFFIAKLSDDYLNVEKQVSFIKEPLEGGALVHYKGLYYVMGSHLSGWRPNPNVYATSKSIEGPWSTFKNIAPTDSNTYGAQSTMLLKIVGSKKTSVIFMADIWKPKNLWDSRYLWMPLQIGDGNMWLAEPKPWTINVKTGEYSFLDQGQVKN